ncbi:MAG TPA: molybdenum cofactor guanylyltransferase [Verrucomicrobiales bacterium]|nr:molybdenum cofactor guanylyltransferase [Verrucomicrobiales bacterium]
MANDIQQVRFAAALIAGGRSRRMGSDKAFLPWEGQPLWEHQMGKLRALRAPQLLLSCRREQAFPALPGITQVADRWPDAGPLGGVGSCLEICQEPYLVVLGIDLPLLPVSFLQQLVDECASGCGAVVMEDSGGYYEPLAAVYPKSMSSLAAEQIAAGRFSMQEFITRGVDGGLLRAPAMAIKKAWFTNVNTPEDLPSRDA